jgi:hypothetical protein
MLIHTDDPLFETLRAHCERIGESLKMKSFPFPTTVENLAFQLFSEIVERGLPLARIEVRETDTSAVHYTREDWMADRGSISRLKGRMSPEPPAHRLYPDTSVGSLAKSSLKS